MGEGIPFSEEAMDTKPQTPEEQLKEVIGGWLLEMRLEGHHPLVCASNLLGVLYDVLANSEVGMDAQLVRQALLMVFERSHPQPMTFTQRVEAKTALDAISNARRKIEGKPHLILGDD
jgi:hypothetical protein